MALINNSDLKKEVIDGAKINIVVDDVPSELGKTVVPVLVANPKPTVQTAIGTASDSTGTTFMTTDAIKRTFLVGYSIGIAKDIVSDSLYSSIISTPVGKPSGNSYVRVRYEPITVGNINLAYTFPAPIELEKGASVRVENSTATGSIDTSCIIFYYEQD